MVGPFSVPLYIESRYRVNRRLIKSCIVDELVKHGLTRPAEVSVAIVGRRKMHELNKKYRQIDKPTNVLSFVQTEGAPTPDIDGPLILGDIIICYPIAVESAARENSLVDDKIAELATHSVRHLLGIHHT